MLARAPYPVRNRPIGRYQARSPVDVVWRSTWPFLASTILAVEMIVVILIISALEIASLAQSRSTEIFGNTSSTGAGLWCGLFFTIAAVLILLINYMPNVRLWAIIALIATIVAACFAVILIGLDAKAVQDRNELTDLFEKPKILSAQLAFACVEFVLCLAFVAIFIIASIRASRRLRYPPRFVMH